MARSVQGYFPLRLSKESTGDVVDAKNARPTQIQREGGNGFQVLLRRRLNTSQVPPLIGRKIGMCECAIGNTWAGTQTNQCRTYLCLYLKHDDATEHHRPQLDHAINRKAPVSPALKELVVRPFSL
jgi:hypothetical protein